VKVTMRVGWRLGEEIVGMKVILKTMIPAIMGR
jgi:hypothetical protein